MDFLSGIFKALQDAWASVESGLVGTPQLAGMGLILRDRRRIRALRSCSSPCWCAAALLMRRTALASAVKRDNEVGARILSFAEAQAAAVAVATFLRQAVDDPPRRTTCSADRSASSLIPAALKATNARIS